MSIWYFNIQQLLHWYRSASFLHCSSLTCAFDPLPRAVIGQGIRARQTQILPLVGEIWHIILSLSHPLRIKFSCPVIFKKFALTGQAWIVESKAQTLYRQSLITGTYSAKCKWWALVGCEGDSGQELSQGSNYRCQETEVWDVKAWSNALQFFPCTISPASQLNSLLSLFSFLSLTHLPFCLSLSSWRRKPVLTQCQNKPHLLFTLSEANFTSEPQLHSHLSLMCPDWFNFEDSVM